MSSGTPTRSVRSRRDRSRAQAALAGKTLRGSAGTARTARLPRRQTRDGSFRLPVKPGHCQSARWRHYIQLVQPARRCQSNPTPDPSPIVRICRPKAPLKIKLFRHNYMTVNDEQHREKEHQGPDRLVQNRYPGVQQSQGKVHRVARKAVGTADGQSRGWAIWTYGSLFA